MPLLPVAPGAVVLLAGNGALVLGILPERVSFGWLSEGIGKPEDGPVSEGNDAVLLPTGKGALVVGKSEDAPVPDGSSTLMLPAGKGALVVGNPEEAPVPEGKGAVLLSVGKSALVVVIPPERELFG